MNTTKIFIIFIRIGEKKKKKKYKIFLKFFFLN